MNLGAASALLAVSVGAASVVAASAPKADRDVESYNYVLGTQTIGPKYRFTSDDTLVETAKAIAGMGSNILKISLGKDYARQYEGVEPEPRVGSPATLVLRHRSFRAVLRMPFSHILLWVYPFDVGWWADGLSQEESDATYRQVYDLTAALLREFNHSGKTFYLGHWEGDWHLHPGYDPSKDPSETMLNGMADWLNVRQRAIEDAKRAIRHRKVEVYGYAEVNLARKAMKGGRTLTNDVLPRTGVDFVSYSSYDSLTADAGTVGDRLKEALDYVESRLRPKPSIVGKRVFIGEYGFPAQHHSPARQADLSRAVARAAVEWGCRFCLYWEMYCNEKPDGTHRGFWLIDEHGAKQPAYRLHESYYRDAKDRVSAFKRERRRLPTAAEFARIGAALLR
jgi:hypothetical protein